MKLYLSSYRIGGRGAELAGLARLFTEAGITARPFFEARGFVVLAPQVVTCRGVEFVNYRMERVLAEQCVAPDTGRLWASLDPKSPGGRCR